MKKLVVIFLILASAFSFAITYNQTDKEELAKMEKAEEAIAKPFMIPNDILLADPDKMYLLLCEAATEFNVNIFRTSINYKTDNQVEIVKYMLLTYDSDYFDFFKLKGGRYLTEKETRQSNLFISTADTGDQNQIGVIKDFGDNNLITIKPLKASYDYLPVDGWYFAEAADDKAFDTFIKGFVSKINQHYKSYLKISYSAEDFEKDVRDSGGSSETGAMDGYLKYINIAIYIITLILLIYYVFNESKRIGIMKMHGVSSTRSWYIMAGRLITFVFVLSAAIFLLAAVMIKNTTYQFVYNTVVYQIKSYLIMIALSFISYAYISRIRVSDVIKNRKDTNGIFALNMLLRIGCSILLVFICLSVWSQYIDIRTKQENLKNWEHSKDYGVFYPLNEGYDGDDFQHGKRIFDSSLRGALYPILNRKGALLINTRMYEETALLLNKDYDGIRSVKVNPNYLREFPVYNINSNPVQVSEDNGDWILLVPEKYHNREQEIKSFFKESRKNIIGVQKGFYEQQVSDEVENQQITIIWLADGQEIFSFNPDVFPAENNVIIDPIIEVVTEKNSLWADRDSILGGGCTDPLKMRLTDRDAALTYKMVEPELKRLKLDDNLKHLVTVDQYIMQEIYDLQNGMKQLMLLIIGLLSGLLLLVVQNLAIFFNKNQRKFIVRRLFGTDFFRTYKEYMFLFSLTWASQLLICFIVNRTMVDVPFADIKLFAVAKVLIFIEFAVSVTVLAIIEQKSKVKVLKGGI